MSRQPRSIQQQIISSAHDKLVIMPAARGSLVQTPQGPIEIQKLKVGQAIFGVDGKIHRVTGAYPQGELNE